MVTRSRARCTDADGQGTLFPAAAFPRRLPLLDVVGWLSARGGRLPISAVVGSIGAWALPN
jgi:hypothetical protein